MANYHALDCGPKQDRVRIAFHIAVPDENNAVDVNLRTAVNQFYPIETSQVPFIDPAELVQIQNGEIYEHIETVEFNANLTVAEKRTICDLRYSQLVPITQDKIRAVLKVWGLNRDV